MFNIPSKIEYVLNCLNDNGYEAYIVGGCVRDMLMGITPHDFDITTSATPEEIISLFDKTIPTGIKHGTVTVLIDKTPIEVTTFRFEEGYTNHRSPDSVRFVKNLKEDLSRRDFTVNAMAYNKKLVDYFDGTTDIKNKVLRAVGNPEIRFKEDALRILRLFRFASTLSFSIEENTLKSALNEANGLKHISYERIFQELGKAVIGENIEALSPLIKNGSLEFLGITKEPDFIKIKALPKELRLFAFLYLSSDNILDVLDILKASNAQKNHAKALLQLLSDEIPKTKADIKKSLTSKKIYEDYIQILNCIFGEETNDIAIMLEEIFDNNEPYLISHLAIDGNLLIEKGYKGFEIGKILNELLNLVIENPTLNTKENLITNLNQHHRL